MIRYLPILLVAVLLYSCKKKEEKANVKSSIEQLQNLRTFEGLIVHIVEDGTSKPDSVWVTDYKIQLSKEGIHTISAISIDSNSYKHIYGITYDASYIPPADCKTCVEYSIPHFISDPGWGYINGVIKHNIQSNKIVQFNHRIHKVVGQFNNYSYTTIFDLKEK